jgi:tetratricopeptide (TPR) repeat protein
MSSLPQTLAAAIQHHQAGRLQQAELLYRQVLAVDPKQADALHLLGVIAYQVGRHDRAIEHIEAALRLRGPDPEMLSNLGGAYLAMGRAAEALSCYQRAVQLRPGFASAHYNLGNVLLGQKRLAEALACYREALRLQPDNVGAHMNLGNALQAQGDLAGAIASFQQALRFNPAFAEAHINLGIALHAQERLPEAAACYRQALQLRPDFPEGHYNLGNTLRAQGDLAGAAGCYRRSLQLKSDNADCHFALGMTLLAQGQWRDGWPEYEWRWRTRDFVVPPFPQPRWDGSDLHGRTILLYAEQGLGDTLQLARYAPLVRQRGGRVLIRCQAPLVPLLGSLAGADGVVSRAEPLPPFDCHAALLSLPGFFGTTPDTVPADIPYLHADPARRKRWRAWLDEHPGRKVGVCWQGNPGHKEDRKRSIPLTALAPLAGVSGVRLVALQVGDGRDKLAQEGGGLRMLDPGLMPDEQGEAFQDLAALMCEIDLVVSVDTALVHLAGALGVPAWVALAHVADWRWLLEREDTPWYPSLRLFRQPRLGDWDSVLARITEALRERLSH